MSKFHSNNFTIGFLMKTAFLLLICLSTLFSTSHLLCAHTLSVSTQNLSLKSGPGANYKTLCQLGKGFPLQTLQTKGSWVKVKDFENDTGWVSKKGLSKTPHAILKTNKGSRNTVNIRSGPGMNSSIKARAYYGVVFMTLGKKNGWTQVKHDSGLSGWIKSDLLWGR